MRITIKILLLLLVHLLIFLSCKKYEWTNPYDPQADKSLFTPSAPGAEMQENAVKLTWAQSNSKISGFELFRSVDGGPITSLAQVQKTTTQYVDGDVTTGKRFTYYIVAVAGSNKSDTIKYSIVPIFPVSVSTVSVSDVSIDSARVSGNVTSAGGGTVISRGICWSTSTGPTVSNNKTIEGTSIGEFVSVLKGLQLGTRYYVRAYGENSRGVAYGSELSFTTLGIPSLSMNAADSVGSTYARLGVIVTNDGASPITGRGVCWSTSENPTIADAKTVDGSGTGSYISRIKELSPSTRYYVRAYATNKYVTGYSAVQTFTTTGTDVVITTSAITNITASSASGGGTITSYGGSPVISRGVCWSTSPNPTITDAKTADGSGTGTYNSNITGLSATTTYYVRAYATNQYGTTYGLQQTFSSVAAITSEKFSTYINFNGINTYVLVGQTDISSKINDAGGSFTMEGWVKSSVRNDQPQTIMSSGSDAYGWWDYRVSLEIGRMIFRFRNGANLTISTDFPNDTLWHHFSLVYESKVATLIFIDGVQKIRSNNLGMQMGTSPNLSFGASIDGTATPVYFFKGGIRQVRISKGVVYNNNFTPSTNISNNTNTIAFWDLGEGSGTTIRANLSSYSGTLLNGSWINY